MVYPVLTNEEMTTEAQWYNYFTRNGGNVVPKHAGPEAKVAILKVAYHGSLFGEGRVQQIQLRTEDRENGDLGGGSPLVRSSGGSCNLVQEISFHIVKFL